MGGKFKVKMGVKAKSLASQMGIQGGFKGLIIHFLGNRAIFIGINELTKVYKDDTPTPHPIISESPPSDPIEPTAKDSEPLFPPTYVEPSHAMMVLEKAWGDGGFSVPKDHNDVIHAANKLADIANRPEFEVGWTPSIRLEMRDLALLEILNKSDLPMYRGIMANLIWKMLFNAQKSLLGPLAAKDFVDYYENSLRSGRRKPLSEDTELAEAFAAYFSKVRNILKQVDKSESPGQDITLEPMENPKLWADSIKLVMKSQTQMEEPTFQQIKEILKELIGNEYGANAKQKNRIWVTFWESLQSSPNSVIPTLSETDWRKLLRNHNMHNNADTDWSQIFRIIPTKPTTCPECGSKEFDKDHQGTWTCRVCGIQNNID
jgi:ribosomal protein S27AE